MCRDHERRVHVPRELGPPGRVFRHVPPEDGERVHPHRQIVVVLAATVGSLADTQAAGPAEHALDLCHEGARLLQVLRILQRRVQ